MKAIGSRKLWCELRQIHVPEGKGRFYGIRNEYRGHSVAAIYLCNAKRIRLQTAKEERGNLICRFHKPCGVRLFGYAEKFQYLCIQIEMSNERKSDFFRY